MSVQAQAKATISVKIQAPRVGLLVLRRKRAGFDPEWGAAIEEKALAALRGQFSQLHVPAGKIVDDASLRDAVDSCAVADCEVLLVVQPTMSDGRLAPVLGQRWDGAVVLWATPEKQEGSMISACSLVGAHTFASTLRQLGRPFELVYGMPGAAETEKQLADAIGATAAARRLRASQVGIIGYHAPGFIDMHSDPFLLSQQVGSQLRHYSLQDLLKAVEGVDAAAAQEDRDALLALGLPHPEVSDEELLLASRYYIALRAMAGEDNLSALAIRDWPELSDVVGQWPYLAISRLLSEGLAVACEGDVDGALTCMSAAELTGNPVYLSDWLEHDHETVTLWHAGNSPLQLCEPVGEKGGPVIARHFNNKKAAVVDATLRAGVPITVLRLWHCDNEYRLAAVTGETLPPRRHLLGTNGLARLDGVDVVVWFDALCHAGLPHHVGVVEGHHVDGLKRLARQMGWRWVTGG